MIVTKLMKFNEVVLFNSTCCALLVLDLIVDMDIYKLIYSYL